MTNGNAPRPYKSHLTSSIDLITSYEATRAGFVTAALEKNKLADPFVDEARTLKVKASMAKAPKDLLNIKDIQAGLLTAAGVSDKAFGHLRQEDLATIIAEFIEKFLEPAGDKFAEELVFRFLLIRGDSLGGQIRNLAGAWAQYRLTRYLLSDMKVSGRPFHWLDNHTKKWKGHADGAVDVHYVRGLSWKNRDKQRVLMFNVKVPLVKNEGEDEKQGKGKNVDICLFDCSHPDLSNSKGSLASKYAKTVYAAPERYLALGELKGGIDPAGADEHWKTADSALRRIRSSFERLGHAPHILFIGGAIQESMADEIWGMLTNDVIANAANLNDEMQMVSLTSWLFNL